MSLDSMLGLEASKKHEKEAQNVAFVVGIKSRTQQIASDLDAYLRDMTTTTTTSDDSKEESKIIAVEMQETFGRWDCQNYDKMQQRQEKQKVDMQRGLAVLRNVASFVMLDVSLHQELLMPHAEQEEEEAEGGGKEVACAFKGETRMLPSLPVEALSIIHASSSNTLSAQNNRTVQQSKPLFDDQHWQTLLAEHFTNYLNAMLKTPITAGSASLAEFLSPRASFSSLHSLSTNKSTGTDFTHDQHNHNRDKPQKQKQDVNNSNYGFNANNFADYIFQGDIDVVSTMLLPPGDTYTTTVEVPMGWWLVWQFTLDTVQDPPQEPAGSAASAECNDGGCIQLTVFVEHAQEDLPEDTPTTLLPHPGITEEDESHDGPPPPPPPTTIGTASPYYSPLPSVYDDDDDDDSSRGSSIFCGGRSMTYGPNAKLPARKRTVVFQETFFTSGKTASLHQSQRQDGNKQDDDKDEYKTQEPTVIRGSYRSEPLTTSPTYQNDTNTGLTLDGEERTVTCILQFYNPNLPSSSSSSSSGIGLTYAAGGLLRAAVGSRLTSSTPPSKSKSKSRSNSKSPRRTNPTTTTTTTTTTTHVLKNQPMKLHRLSVQPVPHDAFRAACQAADEQEKLNQRMKNSPLLKRIVESSGAEGVRLVVEPLFGPWEDRNETAAAAAATAVVRGSTVTSMPARNMTELHQFQNLWQRKEITLLRHAQSSARTTLAELAQTNATLQQDVHHLQSEQTKWLQVNEELTDQVSSLTKQLSAEEGKTTRLEADLQWNVNQVEEYQVQVAELQKRIPSEEEVVRKKKELEDAQEGAEKARDMMEMLQVQLGGLKKENQAVLEELQQHKEASNDQLLDANAEADEAKMMQRILEEKVQELERTLGINSSSSFISTVSRNRRTKTASGRTNTSPGTSPSRRGVGRSNSTKKSGTSSASSSRRNSPAPGRVLVDDNVFDDEATQQQEQEQGHKQRVTLVGMDAMRQQQQQYKEEGDSNSVHSGISSRASSRRRRHHVIEFQCEPPRQRELSPELMQFTHPDPRIHAQLVGLRDRHCKLVAIANGGEEESVSQRQKTADLIVKLEQAMSAIVASAQPQSEGG